jgi:hypothetical protein
MKAKGHITQNFIVEFFVINLENSEINNPHSISDHCFFVICKLLGHQQKREVFIFLVVEKLY